MMDNKQLAELLREAASDIAASAHERYGHSLEYPSMRRKFDSDMELPAQLRAAADTLKKAAEGVEPVAWLVTQGGMYKDRTFISSYGANKSCAERGDGAVVQPLYTTPPAPAVSVPDVAPLQWSEAQEPNEEIRYNHITAETPFGRFEITWKGWKEQPDYSVDESPWGCFFTASSSLEEAKQSAESEYRRRILSALAAAPQPEES